MSKAIAVIFGVGTGLGASLSRAFAQKNYHVAIFARNQEKLDNLSEEIRKSGGEASGYSCDVTSEDSIKKAFESLRSQVKDAPIEVAIYNAGAFAKGGLLELDAATFEYSWRSLCFGAYVMSREVIPQMVERKKGTVIFTGATASLRGSAGFGTFASGKFALRALSQSLAKEFGPQGIHVGHVIVDGIIDSERMRQMIPNRDPKTGFLNPDKIAESYVYLHEQDPSVWTQELDLRPASEKW